ncbi:MAG: hypothetical protein ACRD0R_11840 [Acidimicrobiales bacterium]
MPTPAPSEDTLPTCDSCGAPAADTEPVHRVYVTPRDGDLSGETGEGDDEAAGDHVEVVTEVESWCFPCRSQYPHQPLTA